MGGRISILGALKKRESPVTLFWFLRALSEPFVTINLTWEGGPNIRWVSKGYYPHWNNSAQKYLVIFFLLNILINHDLDK